MSEKNSKNNRQNLFRDFFVNKSLKNFFISFIDGLINYGALFIHSLQRGD